MSISKKRLRELERAESKLAALEAGGVDNWEWYGEALKDFNQDVLVEEYIEDFIEELNGNVLVESIDVEYPAGMDAGHSVTLTEDGEEVVHVMLQRFARIIKEEL